MSLVCAGPVSAEASRHECSVAPSCNSATPSRGNTLRVMRGRHEGRWVCWRYGGAKGWRCGTAHLGWQPGADTDCWVTDVDAAWSPFPQGVVTPG